MGKNTRLSNSQERQNAPHGKGTKEAGGRKAEGLSTAAKFVGRAQSSRYHLTIRLTNLSVSVRNPVSAEAPSLPAHLYLLIVPLPLQTGWDPLMLDLGVWQAGKEKTYQRELFEDMVDILGYVRLFLLTGSPEESASNGGKETRPLSSFSLRYDANGFYDWEMDPNTVYCLRDMDHPSDFTFQAIVQETAYNLGLRVTMLDTAFQ